MSDQDDIDQRTLDLVLNTVNSISLVGAVLVVTTVAVSSFYNCNAAKRLSFRLSMWIALADAIFCCMSYLNISLDKVMECNVITAVGYMANLTYIFLTVCMAFNLQMVFVQQQHNSRLTESFYVSASVLSSIVIVMPFTIIAMAMDKCTLFRLVEFPYNLLLFWLMIGLWEVVGVIYCSITIIKVVVKLTRFHDDIAGLQNGAVSPSVDRISNSIQNRVEQVVRRLVFYPLIPVLTQTPYIIAANLSLINSGEKSLLERYIYYVPSYSAGFLNAIVFLFDPALPEIRKHLQSYLIRKYYQQPLLKGDFDQSNIFTRFMSRMVFRFLVNQTENDDSSRLSKMSQAFFTNFMVPPDLNSEPTLDSSPSIPPKCQSRSSSQTCSYQVTKQKILSPIENPPSYQPRSDDILIELGSNLDQPSSRAYPSDSLSRISVYSSSSTRDLSENQVTLLL